jgi:ferric-dicitrate binding protein FerR (iron transport regulator)
MKKFIPVLILSLIISCAKEDKLSVKITSYKGKITVNSQAVVAINKEIKPGDVIETTPDSSCDITVNEKNILRIKPDTKLILNISGKESTIQLEKGWLAGVTKKVFTREGKFTVKTPTVVASVRGTSFCLKVENEKSTYFCVCNGAIELKGEGSAKNEKVEAAHHSARRFSKDSTGSLIEDNNPGLLYHDDSGIEEMAKIINETVDWSKPDHK